MQPTLGPCTSTGPPGAVSLLRPLLFLLNASPGSMRSPNFGYHQFEDRNLTEIHNFSLWGFFKNKYETEKNLLGGALGAKAAGDLKLSITDHDISWLSPSTM
ncbi:hypothetical protein SORBI_3009G074250 [Sorghum bicolor]|uniref:Uncharacterized protein n=1 Tax=Sorghum bicolor TaxID=4558 RepID=A0A1Z5R1D8_SORBI|nr:hypothetical protein SORBI_3009G074250 [Sorghum bicolor]